MSMSKKDYETIAEVLTTCSNDRDDTILQLASRFAQENPNFRWDLFLKACDYTGDYEIDRFGVIRSPGKFEGENCYMPIATEAEVESDENGYYTTFIRWAGDEAFKVIFTEDNEGFIWEIHGDGTEQDD